MIPVTRSGGPIPFIYRSTSMKTRVMLGTLAVLCAMGTVMAAEKDTRVFEMRTYYASPGKLEDLLARFRNHTLKLFEKHGITNFGYWTPTDKKFGAGETLVYLLAHKDKEARETSFKEFRADPDWVAAKKASEEKAGGSLTASPPKEEFLVPTDYSPTK
jgi:hypothetical protein